MLVSLHMFDRQRGLAIDSAGRLLTTADGGASWRATGAAIGPTIAPVVAVVQDTRDAFVADRTSLLVTTDAGQSFRRLPLPAAIRSVNSLSFPDPRHGWIMANLRGFAGSESLDLFATTDGGRTWARVATANTPAGTPGPLPFGGDKTGIAFRNDRTGWLACTCGLLRTDDGGLTWRGQPLALPSAQGEARAFTFYPPQFFGASNGVFVLLRQAVGSTLFAYRTRDGGNTWQRGGALPWSAAPISPTTFGGPVWGFADAAHGWVVQNGQVFVTADSGQTWRTVATDANLLDVWQLDLLTPEVGWAVQHDAWPAAGQVLRTTDGGRTWTPLAPRLAPGPGPTPNAPR